MTENATPAFTLDELAHHAMVIQMEVRAGDARLPTEPEKLIGALSREQLEALAIQCLTYVTATSATQWLGVGTPGLLPALSLMLAITRDVQRSRKP